VYVLSKMKFEDENSTASSDRNGHRIEWTVTAAVMDVMGPEGTVALRCTWRSSWRIVSRTRKSPSSTNKRTTSSRGSTPWNHDFSDRPAATAGICTESQGFVKKQNSSKTTVERCPNRRIFIHLRFKFSLKRSSQSDCQPRIQQRESNRKR